VSAASEDPRRPPSRTARVDIGAGTVPPSKASLVKVKIPFVATGTASPEATHWSSAFFSG